MIESGNVAVGTAAVIAAGIILVPPVAMMLRRRDAMGMCLSVLGSGVVTSMAGLAALISDTPTRPWFLVTIPLIYGAGFFQIIRKGWRNPPDRLSDRRAVIGAFVAGVIPATVFLLRAPVQWDARSIWFFHASWFAHPSTVYADHATSPVVLFSHPDYPPLAPSFGGFAWLFGEPANDWVAQTATGVLVLAGCAVLAILIVRGIVNTLGQMVVGAVAMLLALGILQGNSLDGYVDGLSAFLIASLALMAYRSSDPAAIAVVGSAASLVKNETLVFLLFVIFPIYLVRRRPIGPLLPGVIVGIAWAIAIRASGAPSTSWLIENMTPWSAEFSQRAGAISRGLLTDQVLRYAAIIWLGSGIIAWALRASSTIRRELLGMGTVGAGLLAVVAMAYLASPQDLAWHLDRSADRLLMHVSLVLFAGAAIGLVGIWSPPETRRACTAAVSELR